MKTKRLVILMGSLLLQIACSSGGSDATADRDTSETCVDGICTSVSTFQEGNFAVQIYESDEASGEPTYSTSGDNQIILHCSGDETSENSYVSTACNMSDLGYIYQTTCNRGFVNYDLYYVYEDGDVVYIETTETNCRDHSVFCDEQGFDLSPACEESDA